MYSTALPIPLPPLSVSQRHDLLNADGLLSFHDALAAVPDPRSRQGQRYALPFLLTCFVAAMLCNCNHITSLSPQQASPFRLLELIRGYWSIENSLHYVRDVTFGEDRSRIRSGQAPEVMAAFRNLAITLIQRSGFSQIAARRRYLAFHPRQACSLLLSQPSSS